MSRIEELRAALDDRTPEPWKIAFDDGSGPTYITGPDNQTVVRGADDSYGIAQGVWRPGDARLIVAAVNALPALLNIAEAASRLLTGSGDEDPLPDEEWDPIYLGLRAALARLESGS